MDKLLEIKPVEDKESILIEAPEVVQAGGGKLSLKKCFKRLNHSVSPL
jgi:hypothetical protein